MSDSAVGIREVSELTGLTPDTLRWYEREGVIPQVNRAADGRRRYGPASVRFIQLVQALRRTGMPVAAVREFVTFGPGTPDNSARRLTVLERQEVALQHRITELTGDLRVMRSKISQYRDLIAQGRDCEDFD
ncbi:MerR family transcriptional regulator [Actinoplanes sp. N902-109]|uniref:MerR family transcriptional regulator n=1 Tax=Actinoplanes sp. (strain N902-109) TaxID=649831 RepID=UPI0003293D3C|nr:MerR family transcriptional regulator [Actinoplanes sp. N902-109]AGL21642.1 MerR family transcriptional regulator [Actinoplanes sp. N902-109]